MPLQTHIRSPLLTAAPISRLRRARAQERGTILFFDFLSQAKFRSAHLDPPEPIRRRKIGEGKLLLFSGGRCLGSFKDKAGSHIFPEGDQRLSRQGNEQYFPNSATIELYALIKPQLPMGSLLVDRENNRMGGRIDVEADDVFELLSELRVRRQLERANAMRRELVGLEDTLHRSQAHSRRFRQHSTSPVGFFSRWRSERQVDNLLHGVGRQRWLPGARVLSRVSPSTPSAMNRACHLQTTGLDLPDRRIISVVPQPSAVARMMLARQKCFCGARPSNDRLKPMAVGSCDVHNNSCSHVESLNCFARFGNRPNESDHS